MKMMKFFFDSQISSHERTIKEASCVTTLSQPFGRCITINYEIAFFGHCRFLRLISATAVLLVDPRKTCYGTMLTDRLCVSLSAPRRARSALVRSFALRGPQLARSRPRGGVESFALVRRGAVPAASRIEFLTSRYARKNLRQPRRGQRGQGRTKASMIHKSKHLKEAENENSFFSHYRI